MTFNGISLIKNKEKLTIIPISGEFPKQQDMIDNRALYMRLLDSMKPYVIQSQFYHHYKI